MTDRLVRVRRFLITPKGLLTVVLLALVALALPIEGARRVLPELAASTIAALVVDAPILRWRSGRWRFPSGALLTGLIVAMLINPDEPAAVAAAISAIGVLSKYLLRTRSANVLNPAAAGLVVAYYAFGTEQNWWGALSEAPAWMMAALVAAGIFITDRVNKVPLVLTFLGGYYLLFTATAFAGAPAHVAEIFRPPDVQMALYFAFFILTDPPTSPVRYVDQLWFGGLVAAVSYGVFQTIGAVYYLLAGVLTANVCEAWRRSTRRR